MTNVRHPSFPSLAASLVAAALLGACGGGGGGGSTPTPPGPDVTPPTVAITAPASRAAFIPGDLLRVAFVADDDRTATVKLIIDEDMDLFTTADQHVLFTGPDGNGVPQVRTVSTTGIPLGPHTLFATADDGTNPVVSTPGVQVLAYPGLAGVTPQARRNVYGVSGTGVVFSVGEAEQGGVPRNNDGLADDGVMTVLNAADGVVTPSTLSADVASPGNTGIPLVLRPVMDSLAWGLREQDQNQDLNADGDQLDGYVAVINPVVNPLPNLVLQGGATPVSTLSEVRHFALAKEGSANQDIDGDGDMLDDVFLSIDSLGNSFPFLDTPRAGAPFVTSIDGPFAAYVVDESIQGTGNTPGIDLRGDGDFTDQLLAIVNVAGGRIALAGANPMAMPANLATNVDPTGKVAVSAQGWVGYYVDEAQTGPVFLNGDTDNTDFIPALYDAAGTQQLFLPGTGLNAGPGAGTFFFENGVAVYTAMEEGVTDRNGDGDVLDTKVLYVTDVQTSPSTATLVPPPPGFAGHTGLTLDGGFAARIGRGWISLVVSEFANNMDLNGDGDTSDFVLLLLDVRSFPVVVHNTGLVPLPTGQVAGSSIPVTGVGNDKGLLVMAAETANGDLNGDGDTSDSLAFYFSFTNPAVRIPLLQTGAVHAAVVNNRIAVTASEILTGQDLDGDGSAFGFVLRVFDPTGALLEPGLPCSQFSVPASFDGSIWAYVRSEPNEARDLNGDGDQADQVLGLWTN